MPTGDVELTILDGGAAVTVPGQSLQVVIGTSSSGTAALVVGTQSPNVLQSTFGYGQLPEAAALSALDGGTILAIKAAEVTAGEVRHEDYDWDITDATNASPIVVTTSGPHLFTDGEVVVVRNIVGNTAANATWRIDVLSSTTFSLVGSTGNGAYVSGGAVTTTGSNQRGSGTSEITITGTPYDDYYVKFLCTTGGTRGTAGIKFRLSLDAGRHYGPVLSLGTASTYTIANTGITLNFSAGTLVAGDTLTFSTIAPASDTAGVIACINALKASPYAITGWGSMHITGVWSAADAATINTAIDNLTGDFIFTRTIETARDASPPAIWGGTAETDAAWVSALQTAFSATDAKRLCMNAGYYNTPSAYPNPVAGAPAYRRPLSWSLAVRQVTIPPQRHAGRVRDGSLSTIVVDPTNDPQDGFVYHDDRVNSGLNDARFCSARTRIGLPGFYIANPNLMSPAGSVFTMLPFGNVMDVACSIVTKAAQQFINDDIRLNQSGTIYENEALAIESSIGGNLAVSMLAKNEISAYAVVVNRTDNILATSIVRIAVTITARGYVLEEDIEIGYQNPFAAGAGA